MIGVAERLLTLVSSDMTLRKDGMNLRVGGLREIKQRPTLRDGAVGSARDS